jgi:hypothetical protein
MDYNLMFPIYQMENEDNEEDEGVWENLSVLY